MTSETLHKNSDEKLKQLEEEIKQGLMEAVNNSKLIELFQQYGLTGNGLVKFQCILDITNIQLSDTVVDQQFKESLRAIGNQELIVAPCDCWCENPPGLCCDCK
ncbi:hypothetical protein [Brasilonema sp. UFV-L1]|uniref:hypothetical protein n=1 Tax=Brasilonema sp. UFV-L1 TaxID=2234130 RepID=UPI00145C4ECE|nr:hypothetical protein [Brasilonema sp. UFV-L1]NMG06388.1 hypothetical protein [Brasilonema sp. UFV-L1]